MFVDGDESAAQAVLEPREQWARWQIELLQSQYAYAENKATFVVLGNTILLNAIIAMIPILCGTEQKTLLRDGWHLSTPVLPLCLLAGLFSLASVILGLASVVVHKNIWWPAFRNRSTNTPPSDGGTNESDINILFFASVAQVESAEAFANLHRKNALRGIMYVHALRGIYNQSKWLRTKFRWLHWSIVTSIASQITFVGAVVQAILHWSKVPAPVGPA